jgi:hypothetical protein
MKPSTLRLLLVCVLEFGIVNCQRNRNRNNNNRNNRNNRRNNRRNNGGGVTRNGSRDRAGTEVYPGCDGKVCLPEAKLCAVRKEKDGHASFNGQNYWFSWESDETALKNARWNWFTARNYCRKRCMDLISIESKQEQDFLGGHMRSGNVQEVWTSARLCDKEVDGCEADRFQPYNIRGWFWAATLGLMGDTNVKSGRKFNGWSHTGPNGKPQPDGILKADGFGNQACAALVDNKFNDGLAWHDTKCNDRRQIICEDLPRGNIQFVRQQNPGVKIP